MCESEEYRVASILDRINNNVFDTNSDEYDDLQEEIDDIREVDTRSKLRDILQKRVLFHPNAM